MLSVTIAACPYSIDRLVRSRRKTVAIVIERDGRLTVRAPLRLSEARIQAFVESHADWIAKTLARLQAAPPVARPPLRSTARPSSTWGRLTRSQSSLPAARPWPLTAPSFRLAKSSLPKAPEAFRALV